MHKVNYCLFAHDVISSHWAPSWWILKIILAVCCKIVVSIYNFIVSLSVFVMDVSCKICGLKASEIKNI